MSFEYDKYVLYNTNCMVNMSMFNDVQNLLNEIA